MISSSTSYVIQMHAVSTCLAPKLLKIIKVLQIIISLCFRWVYLVQAPSLYSSTCSVAAFKQNKQNVENMYNKKTLNSMRNSVTVSQQGASYYRWRLEADSYSHKNSLLHEGYTCIVSNRGAQCATNNYPVPHTTTSHAKLTWNINI